MGMTLFVLLSRTEEILWDNPIPSCIFDYIETHYGLKKKETVKLKRHDRMLIESFRYTYGQALHSCAYAYLMEIPHYCYDVYDIIRIPCYSSSFYPERISIDIERCLELQGQDQGQKTEVYDDMKKHLKHITTYQYGVNLKDSVRWTYVLQRFNIMKNIY